MRLLGPVQADLSGLSVPLGPRQQRLVFGVLALEANRPVSVDRMVDLVWPSAPPQRAAHAIRVCVSQLRSLLATAGVAPTELALVTRSSGYLLQTEPDRVDVHRFRSLVTQAADADDERTVTILTRALALWRGPALADAATPETRELLCGDLEETRLAAMEDRFDALLRLGRQHEVIAALTTLVRANPFRERLVGQLMLALHRTGRASEALRVYRRTRDRLSDELGIDPGAELRELELAILRDEAGTPGPRVLAEPVEPRPLVPAQLPPSIADFTGRADHLRELDGLADGRGGTSAVVVSAIAGTAGVGKTALAVYWAHRVRERYPDGQLYVNLNGFGPSAPVRPLDALTRFLRALGISGARIPDDVTEAADLYRSLLADRRTLVLLDNAATADQVRPLLPAGPGNLVLVTSRNRLDGLVAFDAARRLTLNVLAPDEARALLVSMLGKQRVAAEPAATELLARTCACLPLALRIAAAHLAGRPSYRIADYVAELDAGDVLAALRIEGDDRSAVLVTFESSYSALEPDTRRLFRLLGLAPGRHIGADAAAALTGRPPAATAALLDALGAAHLVQPEEPGRYTQHDLLRHYAVERARSEETEAEREAALTRLFDHYLTTARAAADLLYPQMLRLPLPEGPPERQFADLAAALTWLDTERPNLAAVVAHTSAHGPRTVAWRLADTLRGYFHQRRRFVEWLAVAEKALGAAGSDPQPRASAEFSLGGVYLCRNQYEQAVAHYARARRLCRESGWQLGEAAVLTNLGVIDRFAGDLARAEEHYSQALRIDRELGARHFEATARMNLGVVSAYRGRLPAAISHCRQALAICRDLGARHGEAYALHYLAISAALSGELPAALEHAGQALDTYRELGARDDEAVVSIQIAGVQLALGQYDRAHEHAVAALELARAVGDRRAEASACTVLANVERALGNHARAVRSAMTAVRRSEEVDATYERCEALLALAEAQSGVGKHRIALGSAEHAHKLSAKAGYRLLTGVALTVLTAIELRAGNESAAIRYATKAIELHQDTAHRPGQARAEHLLGLARDRQSGAADALPHWRAAYVLYTEIGAAPPAELAALLDRHDPAREPVT